MILPAAFAVRDAIALAVQGVYLAALRPPLSIRTEGPDRQQDMSVGVATTNSVTLNEMLQKMNGNGPLTPTLY